MGTTASVVADVHQHVLAGTASLLSDSSRATMLMTLLDGRTCAASELASSANVSPQTASAHLQKLVSARLVTCEAKGRFRYFRLRNAEVAQLLENLLALGRILNPRAPEATYPEPLRDARVCYNHLAGRAGVHLFRKLTGKGWLVFDGAHLSFSFEARGLLEELELQRRRWALVGTPCMDWASSEFHIAGDLGLSLLNSMLDSRWFLAGKDRSLVLTDKGRNRLANYDLYPWVRLRSVTRGAAISACSPPLQALGHVCRWTAPVVRRSGAAMRYG